MIAYPTSTALAGTMPRPRRPDNPDWITVSEACELLGVSRSTLFRLLASGDLDSVAKYQPTARKLFFSRSGLEAWIRRNPRR